MKPYLISLIILPNLGLQSCFQTPGTTSQSQCPEQPEVALKSQNVEEVTLNNQTVKKSGLVSQNKSKGYSFKAQKGQKVTYQTKQDICVWLYSPENELLDDTTLTKDGKYILQVSAPKGSTTFELTMGLDGIQPSPTTTEETSLNRPSPTTTEETSLNRASPTQAVIEYYRGINKRDYNTTWSQLSANFQSIGNGYSDYVQWWDRVQEVRIGEVSLIEQSNNQAIVNAKLQYVLKTGRVFTDPKTRIHLVWDDNSGKWLFNNKTKP